MYIEVPDPEKSLNFGKKKAVLFDEHPKENCVYKHNNWEYDTSESLFTGGPQIIIWNGRDCTKSVWVVACKEVVSTVRHVAVRTPVLLILDK